MKITCVGGGPAGLYFAVLAKLRNPSDEIVVCERQPEGVSLGWGLTFLPALLQRLYANDPESARIIEQSAFRWRDQFVDIHGQRVTFDGGVDVYNLNRPRLIEILAARARELGVLVKYETVVTSPRELPEAELIVAADGVSSQLRESAGDFGTTFAQEDDRYLWLGTDQSFDAFAYHFVKTEHGWIWASSYGVESGLSTFVVHCAASTWRGLGFDVMSVPDALTILRDLYSGQLAGHRLIGQVGDETKARWQSFRTVTNERWHCGNVALMGDSAHTTHFSTGEGTTAALEDAIALAAHLGRHDSLEADLTAYERQRQTEIRHVQRHARLSARFMADIPRYANLEPFQFATLLHARRSRLVPLLPPRLYARLRRISRETPILQLIRPAARALRHRLRPDSEGGNETAAVSHFTK